MCSNNYIVMMTFMCMYIILKKFTTHIIFLNVCVSRMVTLILCYHFEKKGSIFFNKEEYARCLAKCFVDNLSLLRQEIVPGW